MRRREAQPDLVLTDYRLSLDTTGLDVIAAVRREVSLRLPTLVLTGDSSYSLIERRRGES